MRHSQYFSVLHAGARSRCPHLHRWHHPYHWTWAPLHLLYWLMRAKHWSAGARLGLSSVAGDADLGPWHVSHSFFFFHRYKWCATTPWNVFLTNSCDNIFFLENTTELIWQQHTPCIKFIFVSHPIGTFTYLWRDLINGWGAIGRVQILATRVTLFITNQIFSNFNAQSSGTSEVHRPAYVIMMVADDMAPNRHHAIHNHNVDS